MDSGHPGPRPSGALRASNSAFLPNCRTSGSNPALIHINGGEGGIRTLEGLLTLTPLAGARLRPLGHLSVKTHEAYRGARDHTRPEQSR